MYFCQSKQLHCNSFNEFLEVFPHHFIVIPSETWPSLLQHIANAHSDETSGQNAKKHTNLGTTLPI